MGLYEDKSEYYDMFMDKINKNYEEEIKNILPLLNSNDIILELGGGTGNFSKVLLDKGFNIICSDISPEMIFIAKRKKLNCKIFDMKNFMLNKKVDVILSLFNTLMYNQNEDELNNNISSCKKNLKPNGRLIIEINNPENLMNMDKYIYSIQLESNLFLTQIDIRENDKLFHHFVFINILSKECCIETHKTKIFSSKEIESILRKHFNYVEIIDKGNHRYYISKNSEL